jgi:hypothetical protein
MHRWAVLLMLGSFGCASGGRVSEPVRDALTERFTLSRIEAPSIGGQSLSRGTKLVLRIDGMPAMPLRITQPNPKLPRVHAGDYALVEVAQDGRATTGPGELRLAMGTQLAVLDLKMDADRVHLFTHTIELVSQAEGRRTYGCTEFVFRFAPALLQGNDPAPILRRIDQWLTPAS